MELWLRTNSFVVSHTPYPTITWHNQSKCNLNGEMRREFGPKG